MKQFRVKNEDDKIFLLIKDGTEVKKVFVGKLEDDTLVCQRDSQKHLFRKFNSYGFSKIVIEEIPFSTIEIHLTDGSILITTKPYLLENGLLRDNDGDEQIHLPISEFGLGKTLIWEKAKRTFPKHYKNFRFLAELAVSSNNSTKHIQQKDTMNYDDSQWQIEQDYLSLLLRMPSLALTKPHAQMEIPEHQFIYDYSTSYFMVTGDPSPVSLLDNFEMSNIMCVSNYFDADDIYTLKNELLMYMAWLFELEPSNEDIDYIAKDEDVEEINLKNAFELYLKEKQSPQKPFLTGLPSLDKEIGGLFRGKLYVLGGEPGCGKSVLSLQIALNIARNGIPCCYLSLEMTTLSLIERIAMMLWGSSFVEKADINMFKNNIEAVKNIPLLLEEKVYDIKHIKEKFLYLAEVNFIKVFVVDYFQRIKDKSLLGDRTEKAENILSEIVQLCHEHNICIVIISSVLIKKNKYDEKILSMSDLKGTGQLAFDPDYVFLLSRICEGSIFRELKIAKQRLSKEGNRIIGLTLDEENLVFKEITQPVIEEKPQFERRKKTDNNCKDHFAEIRKQLKINNEQ